MFTKLKINLIISCIVLYIHPIVGKVVDVRTSSGLVIGQTIDVNGTNVDQFLGIPFAEPPVGRLRFTKPKALQKPIEGVIDATHPKHSCMQLTNDPKLNISEDCLVLNIWTAHPSNSPSSELKPVMFWIHGGAFQTGSIFELPRFNGSILATNDVVLVSTNYRLGPFGNLYAGMNDSPGNLGFFDQLLSLEWVRDNIHLFGGDKNQIIIFGNSAGSLSVSAHILSPLSRGLFQRAIMESGAVFHNKKRSWVNTTEALDKAKQMANHFNCPQNNYWLTCLRKVDANRINEYNGIPYLPVDGTEFLQIFAQEAFNKNLYNHGIDLMAGVAQDDGTLAYSFGDFQASLLSPIFTMQDFRSLVHKTNNLIHAIYEKRVSNFYLANVDPNNSTALRNAFIKFFGDFIMKCPTYLFAKDFAKTSPFRRTYFYELTYTSTNTLCTQLNFTACHGDDIQFVFGTPILTKSDSKVDIEFSREVIKMWTNFAKTGNPGGNWPVLIGQGSSRVKNLNPFDSNEIFIDPFEKTCEQFLKNYFE